MFDSLGDIWNANQQRLEQEGVRPGQMNTAGIAGQLIASGMLPKDAYVQAAKVFRDQELTNIDRQKQQMQQVQQHQYKQLADYVRSNPNASNQEIVGAALDLGVNPANVPAFVATVGSQEKLIEDKLRGGAPVIHQYRAGKHTGVRSAMGGMPANLGGTPLNNNMATTQNVPSNNTAQPNSAGLDYDNMTEEQRLQIANTPIQGQQTMEEKEPADEFLDYSLKVNPKKNEIPLKEVALHNQKTFDKFKEKNITQKLGAARDMNEGLNKLLEASEKFQTGFAGDFRLGTQQLGEYLGLADPENVAAGELIRKVSAKIVLDFAKQMGGGVVSDKDIKFLKEMVPTLSNTPEGNRQIVEYFKRLTNVSEAYATAAEKYYDTYGNLNAFEGTFNKFYKQRGDIFAKEIAELEVTKKAEKAYEANEKYAREHGLL